MKESARYVKIVEWSEEDKCYVGSSPGLILGGCHGDDEKLVFEELCQVVEEAIEVYRKNGKPLPLQPRSSCMSLWPNKCRMMNDE
jgi:predicted RNase H-like HicB family nuclease